MTTTNESLLFLGGLVKTWFDDATLSGIYNIPIEAANIKTYNTTPSEDSSSPNWVIMHGVTTGAGKDTVGAEEVKPRIAIILFTHFEQTEASKEAAERWLNDAEEVLAMRLAEIGHNSWWHNIEATEPRRDLQRPYHGKYRTSTFLVTLDLR